MRVPDWVWAACLLALAVGLFATGYAVRAGQQRRADLGTAAKRAAIEAAFLRTRDSLRVVAVRLEIAAAEADARAHAADRRVEESSLSARRQRATLAGTSSAPDSIPVLLALVAAQDTMIMDLTGARDGYRDALAAQVAVSAGLRTRILTDSLERRELRAIEPVHTPIAARRSPLRVAETGAIALATVGACTQGVTLGCVAGAVVTLARVL